MRVKNETLLVTPADLSTNWQSRAVWLGHIANYTIQIVFSGAPVGTFRLELSSDEGHANSQALTSQEQGVVNWSPLRGSPVAVSGAGSHMFELCDTGANWVRVVYVRTSGSGAVTSARCYVKGV